MLIDNPLENISKIRGVTYDWRKEEFPQRDFADKMQYGVIAQEVEDVLPDIVGTDSEGFKSLDYSELIPLLIESIKELK